MCGIAGIYSRKSVEPACDVLTAMLRAERHRGPETAGIYVNGRVALGHDRLSIIDLSGGLQPISNEDKTVWVVCNGEVFNYVELRAELQARGHSFGTGSDTDAIAHLYEERGADRVQSVNGQSAYALWDARAQSLLPARDRFGIRPLFYTQEGGDLLFPSEIKALLADPRVDAEVDREALDQVFTFWAPLAGRSA